MTSAISQPSALTSLISSANERTVAASMPYFSAPPKISPVTFRITRLYLSTLSFCAGFAMKLGLFDAFADLMAHEAPHLDILPETRDGVLNEVGDFAVGIFDEGLLQKA